MGRSKPSAQGGNGEIGLPMKGFYQKIYFNLTKKNSTYLERCQQDG